MADWDYIVKDPDWKSGPPEPPEPDFDPMDEVACNCDKCGCEILYNEDCFVFADHADKRVFCNGCIIKTEIERQ